MTAQINPMAGTIRAARESGGNEINITGALAKKLAEIVGADDNVAVMIQWFDGDPEQHWHVTLDRADASYIYLIDDETGEVVNTEEVPA